MVGNSQISLSAYYLIYMLGVAGSIVIWMLPIPLQLALFIGYVVLILISTVRAGPLYPAAWFSVFLCLYSINYPLFVLTFEGTASPSLAQILPLNFLALNGFLLGSAFARLNPFEAPRINLSKSAVRAIIWVSSICSLLLLVFVQYLGLGTKREVVDTINALGIEPLFLVFQILTISAICYGICIYQSAERGSLKSFFATPCLVTFVVLIMAFGITGERDLLFRGLLLVFLAYGALTKGRAYKFWHYPALGVLVIYILPFMQSLKGFLLPSNGGLHAQQFASIYWNEFASAGRNLHNIIEWDVPFVYGETFSNAFVRYFDFLGTNAQSSTQWYNQVIRVAHLEGGTSGWGFSLVADAYINFGGVSVFISFLLIGALTSILYRAAARNGFAFVFYLMFIPTAIYVIRADLANLLSLTFKVNVVLVGAVWAASVFLQTVTQKRGKERQ